MKFQIVLAAIFGIAVQMISSKKGYGHGCGYENRCGCCPGNQKVDIDNIANSQANSLAINGGIFGDANAFSASNAANYNSVNQRQ